MLTRTTMAIGLVAALRIGAGAATYEVGAGQPYPTLGSLPALGAGDVVEINPGTYREAKRWTWSGAAGNPIVIRGVGPTRPVIDASGITVDGSMPNGRAAFQIEGSHVVVQHLDVCNARNGNNGAGVRVTAGADDVVIRDCRLHDNDMGIMGDNDDHVLVDASEIDHNGTALFAGASHNVYMIGNRTTFRGCSIHDAIYGQNVKYRGHYLELLSCWIADSAEGEVGIVDEASMSTQPNSNSVLIGNVIVSKDRGPNANGMKFINFGQDLGNARNGTLYAYNNTLVAATPGICFLWSNSSGAGMVARNNIFIGSANIANAAGPLAGSDNWMQSGAASPGAFSTTTFGGDPGFANAAARDFHLRAGAQAIDRGTSALTAYDANGVAFGAAPTSMYEGLGNLRPRPVSGALDLGAYESAPVVVVGPPTVALTSPAGGANVVAPASITVTASASEANGAISRVAFYQNGSLIATDANGADGWSASWSGVPAGSYALTAVATDAAGASATSAAIAVTVTAPPTSPGSGTGLLGQYWTNQLATFTGPAALARTDATIDFDWGSGSPAAAVGADRFTARWTGQVQAPTSETYTFTTTSDDGARLWVNGQLVVDAWYDQGPTEHSGSIALGAGQKVSIQMDFYENGGGATAKLAWSTPTIARQIVPSSRLYPASTTVVANGTGLSGQYWSNQLATFTGAPTLTRTDPTIGFDWGGSSPDAAITADRFSARWTGQVQAPTTETYTFTTTSDDGARLWVNGQLVVDAWYDQSPTDHSGSIALNAGQKVSIRMDFYENGGGATAKLWWATPTIARQIVPQSALFPAATATPTVAGSLGDGDIGAPAIAGSATSSVGTWTVKGSGADIWGASDSFHFASQALSGDGQITARVVAQDATDGWAKAGVMIRSSTAAGSAHAFCAVTPANGVAFQRRLVAGDVSWHTSGAAARAPYWVRLARIGTTVTASQSVDGVTWTVIGSQTIDLGANALIGLAVTSHNDGALCTAVFDNVVITAAPTAPG